MNTNEARPVKAEPKRPYHVGVAIGISTGLYAASLLVTTQAQIATDHALIADREPVQRAIGLLGAHHDWLESRLEAARADYATGASGYDGIADRMIALGDRLAAMDRTVASLERLSASLSVDLSLPTAPRAQPGGTTRSSGGGGGGTTPRVKPPPAAPPPAAQPPPTSGNTGASGG